jgi:hypothetical protein
LQNDVCVIFFAPEGVLYMVNHGRVIEQSPCRSHGQNNMSCFYMLLTKFSPWFKQGPTYKSKEPTDSPSEPLRLVTLVNVCKTHIQQEKRVVHEQLLITTR